MAPPSVVAASVAFSASASVVTGASSADAAASREAGVARLLSTLRRREDERAARGIKTAAGSLLECEGFCGRRERDRQAGWVVASCGRVRAHADTASAAVAILDEVFSLKQVACKYANCVATGALYVARKIYEEKGDESPETFLDALGLDYTPNDLRRMELVVLNLLSWDLLLPSIERFVAAQLQLIGLAWMTPALRQSIESVLVKGSIMRAFRASHLALGIVSLSLERLAPQQWLQLTNTICGHMKVDLTSLIVVREAVSSLLPSTDVEYGHRNPFAPLLLTPDESSEEDDDFIGHPPASIASPVVATGRRRPAVLANGHRR